MKCIDKNKGLEFTLLFVAVVVFTFVAAYCLTALLAVATPVARAPDVNHRQLFENYRFFAYFLKESLDAQLDEIEPIDRHNLLLADIERMKRAEQLGSEKKYTASEDTLAQISGQYPYLTARRDELRLRNLHGARKTDDFIAYLDSHPSSNPEIRTLLLDSLLKNNQRARALREFKSLFSNRHLSPFLKILSRTALAGLLKDLDEGFWLDKFAFLLKNNARTEFRQEMSYCRFHSLTRLFQAEFAYRNRQYTQAGSLLQAGLDEKHQPYAEKILLKIALRQDAQIDIEARLQALSKNFHLYPELPLEVAQFLAGNKEFARAVPLFLLYLQQSRRQEEDHWKAIWLLAWTHYRQGRKDMARTYFRQGGESPFSGYRLASRYWLSKLEKGPAPGLQDYPFSYYTVKVLQDKSRFKRLHKDFVSAIDKAPSVRFLEIFRNLKILAKYGLWQDCSEMIETAENDVRLNKSDRSLLKTIEALIYLRQNRYYLAFTKFRNNFKPIERIRLPNFLSAIFFPRHYSQLIDAYSRKQQVDPLLVEALIREESFFRADSLSPARAYGLMQLLHGTARASAKGTPGKLKAVDLYEPELNIRLGVNHLKMLLDRYDGQIYLALAAYNAGSHRVDQWLRDFPDAEEEEFIEMIPFSETRNYVKNILRNYFFYRYYYEKG